MFPGVLLALALAHAEGPCTAPPARGAVADVAAAAATADSAVGVSVGPDPVPIATQVTHLMHGGTGEREERAILDILAPLDPATLAKVFRLIDQGSDEYDLDHLVYQDVDDAGRRARLLALLAVAGAAEAEAGTLEIAVISDIDDTAAPHHSRQGTKDYFYGAGTLFLALERGPSGAGQAGDLHYVTARPPLVLGDARGRLERAGMPEGTLDDGDLGQAIFRGAQGLEDEKVRDIERQLALHPAQRFVLIGDDSQRDPEVYARIRAAHPERVVGVLIHRVGGEARAASETVFFGDYGEAADAAARWGAISEAQRQAVHAAVEGRGR
ncbi:MAG: App1 family protein [Pseudomonadota bacterium]